MKDYVKSFFLLESFQSTYAGAIIHPHNADFDAPLRFNMGMFNDSFAESKTELTLPPSTRRLPGRPKKRRIRPRMEDCEDSGRKVRVQRCERCHSVGHSKRTCTEAIG